MARARVRKRSRDQDHGFLKSKQFSEYEGHEKCTPADDVEAVLERYTGRSVSLDRLYPSPPPEPTGNPALDYTGAAPRRPEAIMQSPQRNTVRSEEAYRKEHMLRTVHRFMLRGASLSQIANALSIDMAEAGRLRGELNRRIGREASSIDFPVFVGMSMGFYQEVRSLALRAYDSGNVDNSTMSHKDRIGYLNIAKAAEDSQHRLLQVAGFYDNVKLTPAATVSDDSADDMTDMHEAMKMLLDPSAYMGAMEATLNDDTGEFEVQGPDEDDIRVL